MLIGSFPKYLHMIDISGTHDQSQDCCWTQQISILFRRRQAEVFPGYMLQSTINKAPSSLDHSITCSLSIFRRSLFDPFIKFCRAGARHTSTEFACVISECYWCGQTNIECVELLWKLRHYLSIQFTKLCRQNKQLWDTERGRLLLFSSCHTLPTTGAKVQSGAPICQLQTSDGSFA